MRFWSRETQILPNGQNSANDRGINARMLVRLLKQQLREVAAWFVRLGGKESRTRFQSHRPGYPGGSAEQYERQDLLKPGQGRLPFARILA